MKNQNQVIQFLETLIKANQVNECNLPDDIRIASARLVY